MVVQNLPNAPIVEAVIDIQFDLTNVPIVTTELELAGYSKVDDINMMEVSIHPGIDGLEQRTNARHIGFRYVSKDDKFIIQIRRDGFSYSQLRPYTNWDEFSRGAKSIWDRVFPVFGNTRVRRVAVRYINRLLVPLSPEGVVVFKHYFSNAPDLPSNVEADVQHYLTRMVISPKKLAGSVAVVNQTLEVLSEGKLPLILDIDVFLENTDLVLEDPHIWELLANLRVIKNDIFAGTMTATAIELCQ